MKVSRMLDTFTVSGWSKPGLCQDIVLTQWTTAHMGAVNEGSGEAAMVPAPAVEKLCRRCKAIFEPSSNSTSSCRFHPSFFVSRRHDDQKRFSCTVNCM